MRKEQQVTRAKRVSYNKLRVTKSCEAGLSLIEFVVTIALLSILATLVVINLKPREWKARARDVVRLSDLATLMQAIESFYIDNGFLPDIENVIRQSDTPLSGTVPQESDGTGWIGEDLSDYLSSLPADPLNEGEYIYRYRFSGKRYELDARLEYYTFLMNNSEDKGDDDGRYERGTDLNLL